MYCLVSHKARYLVQNYLQLIHCPYCWLCPLIQPVYADDTHIYITFRTSYNISENISIQLIQSCIAEIKIWMLINKLQLNDEKIEFMLIASPYSRKIIITTHINIGNDNVRQARIREIWETTLIPSGVDVSSIYDESVTSENTSRRKCALSADRKKDNFQNKCVDCSCYAWHCSAISFSFSAPLLWNKLLGLHH